MKCYTPGYGFIVPIGTTVVHRFQLLHCRPCTQMLLPPQSSSLLHCLRSRAPVLAQRGRARAAAAVRALAPRSGAGSATQRREVRPLCVVLAHANGIVRSAARARGRRAETLQG